MKEDPPPDAKCRDKFLVQSVAVSADKDVGNVAQIWASIESTAKSSIQEKKIRVTFLPADGSSAAATTAGTNGVHDDEPPAYSSPSPMAVTPQRSSASAVGAISTPSDKPADAKSRGDAVDSAYNPAMDQPASSSLGAAAAAVTSAIPTSGEDLRRQLDAANAQIKNLQQQASDGLRQRKVGSEGEKQGAPGSTMGMQNAPAPGGVPVQIVAALCLLCFLIAYLFF